MQKAERHALCTFLAVPAMAVVVVTGAPLPLAFTVLAGSVLALLRLVWIVLHDTASTPPDLIERHEWDYLDRMDLLKRDEQAKA